MFRVAKQMKKDKKDVKGGTFIKDENDNLQIEEKRVRDGDPILRNC